MNNKKLAKLKKLNQCLFKANLIKWNQLEMNKHYKVLLFLKRAKEILKMYNKNLNFY